eukprot:gnl/TRDRNA2_/TRDRNA2_95006_c0_seq1.p1 gnl/TRDRNA2_/TRDRNA2_95006_c0~~gnl/TRDRNA2_/TRDRNA2_95006_c0_seq1.p1  ORF type:complete len:311 (+),score=35.98 gnl/TRDRNA2_/TRDRNA2_95006_c0_seq1:653-1585(+)
MLSMFFFGHPKPLASTVNRRPQKPHAGADKFLDAEAKLGITRLHDVIPPTLCAQVVEIAKKRGLDASTEDSVDMRPTHDITIAAFDNTASAGVHAPYLYGLLQPHLEALRQRLAVVTPGFAHKIGWIFLRRYKSGSERDELAMHDDANLHTVTVTLNSDYFGGDLVFLQSPKARPIRSGNMRLAAGDGILYPKGVFHGIAKVLSGERYALVVFFDVPGSLKVTFISRLETPARLVRIASSAFSTGANSIVHVGTLSPGLELKVESPNLESNIFRAMDESGSHILAEWNVSKSEATYYLDADSVTRHSSEL